MVVVRLQRIGTKKISHHRVVVTDRRSSQRSRVLEIVGHCDTSSETPRVELDGPRLAYWVSAGAQVSPAVRQLLKRQQRALSAKPSTSH